jgi:Transposase, Mutator family
MRTPPPAHRDLWRAGCVEEAHVRFGRRAGETHRWKHRQGAPVRPHHVNIRREEHKLCLLVMIGVRADGRKELIALAEGYRESAESWAGLLRDCARRGMRAPVLAVGDGALGLWNGLREVFPEAREGRCWFHYADVGIMPTRVMEPLMAAPPQRRCVWRAGARPRRG